MRTVGSGWAPRFDNTAEGEASSIGNMNSTVGSSARESLGGGDGGGDVSRRPVSAAR